MGYAEDFEKWLDDDLETLAHCRPQDRSTVEKIITAWAGRPARAVAVRAFFANWATAIESGNAGRVDAARRRAEQALRLDDKYRRLRETCDALVGAPRTLPASILESRAFWEAAHRELALAPEPLSFADWSRDVVANSRLPPDRPSQGPLNKSFWTSRHKPR